MQCYLLFILHGKLHIHRNNVIFKISIVAKPPISIKNVDMLWNHNQESNESDEFETTKYMVLRRGFQFDFIVEVSSLGDLATEKVTFELHRGGRARYTRGTLFQAICGSKSRRYYQWKMEVCVREREREL